MYHTTWGPLSGGCGHKHRSYAGLNKCLLDHKKDCEERGVISDREVRELRSGESPTDGSERQGPGTPLSAGRKADYKASGLGTKEEEMIDLDRERSRRELRSDVADRASSLAELASGYKGEDAQMDAVIARSMELMQSVNALLKHHKEK